MNKEIMKQATDIGLIPKKFMERVENKLCPFCGKPVDPTSFKDELSKREYSISGICQSCQDDTFGE